VVAEFAGFWLLRLLHGESFPALDRGHLVHHFPISGPQQPHSGGITMRPETASPSAVRCLHDSRPPQ
jgi:hypothetical protein